MKVRFSARAIGDIDRIGQYIAKRNPRAAAAVTSVIRRKVDQLANFPHSGKKTALPRLHEAVLGDYPYRVLFSIQSDHIRIVSVRHAARRWPVDIDRE